MILDHQLVTDILSENAVFTRCTTTYTTVSPLNFLVFTVIRQTCRHKCHVRVLHILVLSHTMNCTCRPDTVDDRLATHTSGHCNSKQQHTIIYIIQGDFNVDLLKTAEHEKYANVFDTFCTNSFLPPKLIFPTRFAKHSCSLSTNLIRNVVPQVQ